MNQGCLCIFGEVLFDHFPDGNRILGGAPFNVAWHLQAFGQSPCFISRIGADAQGEAVTVAMEEWGMRTDALQVDPVLPTGRVDVRFTDGEPSYVIAEHCAYDAIDADVVNVDCRLLYHGSLSLREMTSKQAVEMLRSGEPEILFIDINLRPPWWQLSQIEAMLENADWVKLNSDELDKLDKSAKNSSKRGKELIDRYGLKGLLVTHGSAGAEAITATGDHVSIKPGKDIEVVDTVGAGDAFASVMIMGLANDWPLETALSRAQAFASGVVANQGATVNDMQFYRNYLQDWKQEV